MPTTQSTKILVTLPPESKASLDILVDQDAEPGEKPNVSRTVRRLIHAEAARRAKPKKRSQT